MKRCLTLIAAFLLLAIPLFAAAQGTIPLGPTPLQMLTVAAQLEAQEAALASGQSLACAAVFSTSSVSVGQNIDLAWGSVGALDPQLASTTLPMWAPEGGSVLSFTQVGTWTYSFTFYSATNATATCTAKVRVTK